VSVDSGKERDLFKIAANPPFVQILVEVKRKELDELTVGDKVAFTVEELPDRVFEGHVGAIRPATVTEEDATPDSIVIDAGNPDLALKSGMQAQVKITPARQSEAQGS
jgi:multidrug efflux pump subunit AcrA (membrane-fusion protein)